ncbi:dipeptidase 1 [Tribolium castaneum]|uniref:Dipeptidase n=1 Tax=Tribolium castaneum TaxID=7070 RepID=D6WVT6_TRICA|nr:PREDICTED: dipeptidase 1 [Tribolium castaneum]EFA08612.1 Putative dipeptidase MCYG_02918-like Protein [Tribolium castaneum]|eukprot:XP_969566.1 PREDICTED: dipeptidase 1 [Tribolium castaneum]
MLKLLSLLAILPYLCHSLPATTPDLTPGRTALDNFPLIDGHNDLPYNLYSKLKNQISKFAFDSDLSNDTVFGFQACKSCFTDLERAKKGKLGGQFWVAYVDCNPSNYSTIVSRSFEQVDVIQRLIKKFSDRMQFVTTADGILDAFKNKKIASLIGLEGGHSIDNKMALLRQFYDAGVRYMTLTHTCNLPWADASPVDDSNNSPEVNLTKFGEKIVLEMNRLGMLVDLSHVSHNVMSRALDVSKAPVIFSHSSAFTVHNHHRNVQDDVLEKVKLNQGVVMVNFYTAFVGNDNATIDDVIKHINHIVDKAGIDCVGIGSDYDGVSSVPKGLEDVSKYPDLFDKLKEQNPERWTIANLEKLAGKNLYRVFKSVEAVRDQLATSMPDESLIPDEDLAENTASVGVLPTFISIVISAIILKL